MIRRNITKSSDVGLLLIQLEYFRCSIDRASQETTVVHRIFGGYLRSQVKCQRCHHESNTYEPSLDMSVDIKGVDNLLRALHNFVQPETLDIENAYKCDK